MQTVLKLVLSVFLAFGFVVSNASADGGACADGYVYAVGKGASESVGVSMDKARLDAEFGLAEQTKKSNVGGYEVVKQTVEAVQGKFHTYVLLRLAVR